MDGVSGSGDSWRYNQMWLAWAPALNFYRDMDLISFYYHLPAAGYRGWQPSDRWQLNGYVRPVTRSTFAHSVGKAILHAKTEIPSAGIWSYANHPEPPYPPGIDVSLDY